MSNVDNLRNRAKFVVEGDRAMDITGQMPDVVLPRGPEPTVADSVATTLAQRGSRYGDFTDHAKIAQSLQDVMRGNALAIEGDKTTGYIETNWDDLDPVKKQALTVIADKIARILSGDPNYDDNWHDIQGYAKLVEDRLPKSTEGAN